jgi:hypothetical protein
MPLLPRKNNLDYQPDNIIQASKQLTTIALENMKNPLTDPDQPALNSLTSQKSLTGSMNEFSKMLIGLQNSFVKAKQEAIKIARENGADVDLTLLRGEGKGGTRTKGSKNKPKTNEQGVVVSKMKTPRKPSKRRVLILNESPQSVPRPIRQDNFGSLYDRVMRGQPQRSAEPIGRYGVLPIADYSRRVSTTGAVADPSIYNPDEDDTRESALVPYEYDPDDGYDPFADYYGDPNGDPSDDDSSYSSRSSRSERRNPFYWADDADGDDTNSNHYPIGNIGNTPPMGIDVNITTDQNPTVALSNLLLDITKQIRYMDLLVISNIKPSIQQLDTQQLAILSSAYQTLTQLESQFRSLPVGQGITLSIIDIFDTIIPFGTGITKCLMDELQKLKLDLLIVVNSYKQNEVVPPPNFTPNTFWDTSEVSQMEGGGRTFTGKNHSGRDIPTIWRGAQRECAYKYML